MSAVQSDQFSEQLWMQLCILGSGSAGNSSVLRSPGGCLLIDAGLGPRTTAGRLAGTGVSIADISAICLTHLDRDHFNPSWISHLIRRQIRVWVHRSRLQELNSIASDPRFGELVVPFEHMPFAPLPGVECTAISFAHDADGSHGFLLSGFGNRIGYATDLGHVPDTFYDRFCALDVLAIESNYDEQMQRESSRPRFLKQRIMGGRGHLSNAQAFAAVRQLLDRCERRRFRLPGHLALLHLSRQCNAASLVRELFESDRRLVGRLTLSEQDERTGWLGRAPLPVGEQLMLSWG